MYQDEEFEKRKEIALEAARKQGIVDVVTSAPDGISLETVNLATDLMKKHGVEAYKRLDAHRTAKK